MRQVVLGRFHEQCSRNGGMVPHGWLRIAFAILVKTNSARVVNEFRLIVGVRLFVQILDVFVLATQTHLAGKTTRVQALNAWARCLE